MACWSHFFDKKLKSVAQEIELDLEIRFSDFCVCLIYTIPFIWAWNRRVDSGVTESFFTCILCVGASILLYTVNPKCVIVA